MADMMIKFSLYVMIVAFVFMAQLAYANEISRSNIVISDSVTLTVVVRGFEHADGDGNAALVRGMVVFERMTNAVAWADLRCIYLSVQGESLNGKIYIDSDAHIFPYNYKLDRPHSDVPVYWIIEGRSVDSMQGEKIIPYLRDDCTILQDQTKW